MTQRETYFAALTAVSACLIVAGVSWFSIGAALIVAGPLLAGWSWFVLAGDEPPITDVGDEAENL